ncbi:MAG TPA: PIG-L family deacetylase [Gemmatimonadales bacterium]
MIAAHPDDEDTELLTVLGRGMGAEIAYLSLTRGEGGQNLIGDELGPALGVLRTGELLAARGLDGGRQYFTRAYDFGFSKSLADTWRFWPQDSVLKDVVRIVRRFQPQVIVTIFSGTPRDGHGQHQAAGWAAREAFRAAADSSRFPELKQEEGLGPWQPLKLYQSARFGGDEPNLLLEGGVLDRAVGQSYLQIAMRGRSLHRSQDMGVAQRIGPSPIRLRLIEDRTGAGSSGFFAGVDTSLAAGLGLASAADRATADSVAAALRRLTALNPGGLAALRRRLAALLGPESAWSPAARDQMQRLDDAAYVASGVLCDATSPSDRIVAGGHATVVLSCWNSSPDTVEVGWRLELVGSDGPRGAIRRLGPGELATDTMSVAVAAGFPPTEPYFLRSPLRGALYPWPPGEHWLWGLPFEPAPLMAEFVLDGGSLRREVQYRFVDQALGEVRRPVFVVPRIDVAIEPASGLWPRGVATARQFTVRLRHFASDTTEGTVTLDVPEGWIAAGAQPFHLAGTTDQNALRFRISPGAAPATGPFRVVARDAAGRVHATGITRVDYPHVRARQVARLAEARIVVATLKLPLGARLGYVRGAADRIPEALSTLGLDLVLLTRDSLARGDLSRYRSITIGPRAYETEPALELYNGRLLEYVRNGGTLVVQYQQLLYFRGGYAPYPLALTERLGQVPARVSAARVAEEDAKVTVLQPTHPAMTEPNRLTDADWSGWVQERGLYFPRSWSGEWTPLLEMADAGEPPQRGALLIARYGKGVYVYAGVSFFRQLPAAVPGAARLFLNLMALR